MRKHKLTLPMVSLSVLAILLASCGVGPTCKTSSCDSNTPAPTSVSTVQSDLMDGVFIQNSSSDLTAGEYVVPVVYDWDNDGKKDLLAGYNDPGDNYGYIRFYKNVGTDASPVFNGYTLIQACNNTCDLRVTGISGY